MSLALLAKRFGAVPAKFKPGEARRLLGVKLRAAARLLSPIGVRNVSNAPTIRLVSSKQAPKLTLAAGLRWHLYLSYSWSTGQDACATIKTQLQLLLPNVKIFLDVTDVSLAPLVSVAFMTGTRASE